MYILENGDCVEFQAYYVEDWLIYKNLSKLKSDKIVKLDKEPIADEIEVAKNPPEEVESNDLSENDVPEDKDPDQIQLKSYKKIRSD